MGLRPTQGDENLAGTGQAEARPRVWGRRSTCQYSPVLFRLRLNHSQKKTFSKSDSSPRTFAENILPLAHNRNGAEVRRSLVVPPGSEPMTIATPIPPDPLTTPRSAKRPPQQSSPRSCGETVKPHLNPTKQMSALDDVTTSQSAIQESGSFLHAIQTPVTLEEDNR
jgi:hypothetical protein